MIGNFLFLDLAALLSDLSGNDRRAPGCEKKSLEMHQNLTPFDYEQKKMLAVKAMQSKPNPTDYRVPNSAWTGYGLSQSTPLTSAGDMTKVNILNISICFRKQRLHSF